MDVSKENGKRKHDRMKILIAIKDSDHDEVLRELVSCRDHQSREAKKALLIRHEIAASIKIWSTNLFWMHVSNFFLLWIWQMDFHVVLRFNSQDPAISSSRIVTQDATP